MTYKQEKREKRNTKTKPQLYGLIRKMRGVYLLELIDKSENVHVYIYKFIQNISARTLYGDWTRLTSKIYSNGSFA
jgi:hypothetical protein